VVSRAISKQINDGKEVFIDLRHLTPQHIESKLPSLQKAALMQAGVDITSELLPIKPVAHYTMGGIEANMTKTAIKGLFACGECAVNGVHGANRLGGNSLLEGAVFGELAGRNALKYSERKAFLPIDYNIVVKDQQKVDYIFDQDTTKNFNSMRISVGKTMFELAGISRNKQKLFKALDYLKYLRRESGTLHCIDKGRNNNVELVSILELQNALEVAQTVVISARKRKESRGAHHRDDYPDTNDEYRHSILVNELKRGFYKVWLQKNNLLGYLRRLVANNN